MSKNKVEDHLRLVGKIAKRYSRRNEVEFEDVYQEGCLGLIRACEEYKEGPVPFGAFAGQHITFAVLNYLKRVDVIRTPHYAIDIANRMSKYNWEDMTLEEIADCEKVSTSYVNTAIKHLTRRYTSIDGKARLNGEETARDLIEIIASNEEDDNLFFIETLLNKGTITTKEYTILTMHYKGYSTHEIAAVLNTSSKVIGFKRKSTQKRLANNHVLRKSVVGV